MGGVARVVVVGAGLGGLAAAARLAAAGHAVTVVEQAPQVGGKLGWFARDGHGFDTGPSLLTLPQVFEDLFAATGTPLAECWTCSGSTRRSATGSPTGRRRRCPAGSTDVAGALDADLGAGAGAQWSALLTRAEAMWRATEQPFLRSPLAGPATLARLARAPPTCAPSRRGRTLRGLGRRVPDRPAAADAAGPLRHLLRLRPAPGARRAADRAVGRSRRSAPGTSAAGCAGCPRRWPTGRSSGAPSSAPARR